MVLAQGTSDLVGSHFVPEILTYLASGVIAYTLISTTNI